MRWAFAIVAVMSLAGCGGGIEERIAGPWLVDPASIQTAHLAPGAATKPEWTEAAEQMERLRVDFKREPKVVIATGFGETSRANWSVVAGQLKVEGQEGWPTMVLDPKLPRIHLTLEHNGDQVLMDLVRG